MLHLKRMTPTIFRGEIMPSKHRISINLSEREYGELSSLSTQYNVSMAWLGRMAIDALLEKIEKEQVQPPLNLFPKKINDEG